jgi:hypothetical protein
MVEELYPPDQYRDNPHYPSGPLASLYRIDRIEAWVEQNQGRLHRARLSRAKRSAATKAAHDRKRAARWQAATEWVQGLTIEVERPLPGTLFEDAGKCYGMRGDVDCLAERGLHAYLRHRLSNYDALLRQVYGQEFSQDLYPLLRERVDGRVAEALLEWKHAQAVFPNRPRLDRRARAVSRRAPGPSLAAGSLAREECHLVRPRSPPGGQGGLDCGTYRKDRTRPLSWAAERRRGPECCTGLSVELPPHQALVHL